MHCNLKPPDIVPIILCFHYEAHNAPVYNQHSTIPQTPSDSATPIFSQILVIDGYFTNLFGYILLCLRRNGYFRAFDQNPDIASTFAYPDFLKDSNNSAIRIISQCRWKMWHISISGLFDLMTLNMCHRLRSVLE